MLVVGPNLSVDQTVAVPRLMVGTIHRVPAILRLAGGKGTNLARALRTLGEDPLLCGFVGGPTGEAYRAYLRAEGIAHQLVATRAETRVCFSIADESTSEQTEFYEAGAGVDPDEVEALIATASAAMAGHDWLALTGSLPRGTPDDLYARLVALGRERGLRVLVDAREPALGRAIAAGPDVLKVNRDELSAWADELVRTPDEAARAGAAALEAGARSAVITMGAAGAVALDATGCWHIAAPTWPVRSPVGSGDSAAAGLLVGLRQGMGLPEAARLAVAAGTANARHLGAGRFNRAEVDALLAQCRLRRML